MPAMVLKIPAEDGKTKTPSREDFVAKRQFAKWLRGLSDPDHRREVLKAFNRDPEVNPGRVKKIVFHPEHGIQGAGRELILKRLRQTREALKASRRES